MEWPCDITFKLCRVSKWFYKLRLKFSHIWKQKNKWPYKNFIPLDIACSSLLRKGYVGSQLSTMPFWPSDVIIYCKWHLLANASAEIRIELVKYKWHIFFLQNFYSAFDFVERFMPFDHYLPLVNRSWINAAFGCCSSHPPKSGERTYVPNGLISSYLYHIEGVDQVY